MKNIILTLILIIISITLDAQNLFPVVLKNCDVTLFCLDCGDIKANLDQNKFKELIEDLNKSNDLNGVSGSVILQLLIDSLGNGCVLSHTDNSKSKLTKDIIKNLNKFTGWIPAITNGKKELKTSINMSFEIKKGVLTGKIERVDIDKFEASFDQPVNPQIYNKKYDYKNDNLNKYKITVWNKNNSNLPNNQNDNVCVDKNDIIWLTVDKGLFRFDGKKLINSEQNIIDEGKYFQYNAIGVDNNNIKWVATSKGIFSYDDKVWTKKDSSIIGITSAYKIINNERTGEVYFCSDSGLTILNNGVWRKINKNLIKELPSNRVFYAQKDTKDRIWIGTFSGSIMIDKDGKVTDFNKSKTPLRETCISSIAEDENENIYFELFDYTDVEAGKINKKREGIAKLSNNGDFKHYSTSNSGIPINYSSNILYDKKEKVLWIATDKAGLVRFDLNEGWENYNNTNSDIPTSFLMDIVQNKKGDIYLGTRQGLVKIEKIR